MSVIEDNTTHKDNENTRLLLTLHHLSWSFTTCCNGLLTTKVIRLLQHDLNDQEKGPWNGRWDIACISVRCDILVNQSRMLRLWRVL